MNNVSLMGNLTKDVEIRYSQSADPVAVARFTLAVARPYKREGEPDADFIFCKVFKNKAEVAAKYLQKGHQVGVQGRIQVTSYKDQQGNYKTITEIIVSDFTFCKNGSRNTPGASDPVEAPNNGPGTGGFNMTMEEDDDLPF